MNYDEKKKKIRKTKMLSSYFLLSALISILTITDNSNGVNCNNLRLFLGYSTFISNII